MSEYKEEHLPDLLPLYYKRLFPAEAFYKWLSYGDNSKFSKREISFTLFGDVYLRYRTFNSLEALVQGLTKMYPIKIDIGAIYKSDLQNRNIFTDLTPVERELVFDIDLTDYDPIRTCCESTEICSKCWKFMVIACKIIDGALREDFAFEHILWVFSGRRGLHCWVADARARVLDDYNRSIIAEFLQVMTEKNSNGRVRLPYRIHHSLKRSLRIINEYFEKYLIKDQDFFSSTGRLSNFIDNFEEQSVRDALWATIDNQQTSEQKWKNFVGTFQKLLRNQQIPRHHRNLIQEIQIFFAYPRLDINVSKNAGHLLKAPFCVHPKTGKICVPVNPKSIDNFDPFSVPTISQLAAEVDSYDTQIKEQQKTIADTDIVKIKDYKKTSLLKYITVFNEFLRGLRNAALKKGVTNNVSGTGLEF